MTIFQTAEKTKKSVYKDFHVGVPYWIFPKRLTHDFDLKL